MTLPNGEDTVFKMTMHGEGVVSVVKDAGDDPDVTNGVQIVACVIGRLDGHFSVDGAEGVGRVTLEGLPVKPGEAAINPVPLKYILGEAERVLPRGADVTISIPEGEELASQTFNPRLGIIGGLSVLGTTGRVEPWSSAAYQESLLPQLDIARAAGVKRPVLVPGAKGERAALAAGCDQKAIVQTGNFTGMMLAAAEVTRVPAGHDTGARIQGGQDRPRRFRHAFAAFSDAAGYPGGLRRGRRLEPAARPFAHAAADNGGGFEAAVGGRR